ncbi:daptide biosynthesis intramembrane metalloprotease [Rathayibacter rathayi]|uniref:daptide biosynthesis intramembrane metalloprotease n=1 Tax=Rathayibacter rathayi TaxID=33887 RepID=UPI0030B87843
MRACHSAGSSRASCPRSIEPGSRALSPQGRCSMSRIHLSSWPRGVRTHGRHRSDGHTESGIDLRRPRLRPEVTIVDQGNGSPGTWLVASHDVPVARVTKGTVGILMRLDGIATLDELTASSGGAFTLAELETLIENLRRTGLIVGSADAVGARSRVVSYRPPMTIQVATRSAAAFFATLARVTTPMYSRVALFVVASIVAAGLGSAIVSWQKYVSVGSAPLKPVTLIAVLVALTVATFFHELAHGLTLQRFGGVPRRAGFMLFYLAPAFFVDVTDGWRLPRRWQRAAVAFAGPALHLTAASAAALIALAFPTGGAQEALYMFSFAAFGIFGLNLVPFVRFDGYLVLMALLDRPNLRTASIAELGRVLFAKRGGSPSPSWVLAAFGLGSIVFPAYLVFVSFSRLQSILVETGATGALVLLSLEAVVAVLLARSGTRVLLRKGYSTVRAVGGVLLIAAALTGVLAAIQVPITYRAGWVSDEHGTALVAQNDSAFKSFTAGSRVSLRSQGIIFQLEVGTATISENNPSKADIPIESLAPVSLGGVMVSGYRMPLLVSGNASLWAGGAAIVSTERTESLMQLLFAQILGDPTREIFDQFDFTKSR